MSRLTLAQQLLELDEPRPKDVDIEDETFMVPDEEEDAEDETIEDVSSKREYYVSIGASKIRRELPLEGFENPKYDGTAVSRKDLQNQEFDEEEESDEEEEEEELSDSSHEEAINGQTTLEADDDDDTAEQPKQRRTAAHFVDDPEPISENISSSRDADILKGKAVIRQAALYDALLSARIRIQKAVAAANQLPSPGQLGALHDNGDNDLKASLDRFFHASDSLNEDMWSLRSTLLKHNESLEAPPRKRIRLDGVNRDTRLETIASMTKDRNALEQSFHPHLLQILHKWSQKINAVSPATLLSNTTNSRTSFKPRHQAVPKGATELIEEALRDRGGKLWERTKTLRSVRSHEKEKATDDGDRMDSQEDVFDDTDFYHQLLRDIVEAKRGENGAVGGFHLPNKPPKVKKNVDTRASKGRKLRYTAHEKLQNFMVPIPVALWHDEQVTELIGSLFGKQHIGKSGGAESDNLAVPQIARVQPDGFRIFG